MTQYNIIRYALGESRVIHTFEMPNKTPKGYTSKKPLRYFERFCMYYRASLNVNYPIKLGMQKQQ